MKKKPVPGERMSFEIFGVRFEARTPIALTFMVAIVAISIFWYWPQIQERFPNLPGLHPAKPYTLLCSIRFDKTGSTCSGWNEDNVVRSDGALFCTPADEIYRAVYYVFDLDPTAFSFSIRFKARNFEPPSAANNYEGRNNIITLGEGHRWFSLRENFGRVEITANNGKVAQVLNDSQLSPGEWHNIFASVDERKKRVILLVNGLNSFNYSLPENFKFSVDSVLESDPLEAGFSLVDRSNNSRFNGCVDYLYVYSRAMSVAEMKEALRSQGREAP
jgi:hypothetical protein